MGFSIDLKNIVYQNMDEILETILNSSLNSFVDFKNIKTVYNIKLLGVFVNIYQRDGKMILSKYENEKYALSYAKINFAQRVGFDRPIKLIEKNKNVRGRRKQNEVSCDLHFIINSTEKKELIVFESENLSNEDFDSFTETPNILPEYLDAYDPSFWEGYNIIEPNEALKNWKLIETDVN